MSTVLWVLGLRVAIPVNEHGPAHVHVFEKGKGRKNAGKKAKFFLNCPHGPVEYYESRGFNLSEISKIGGELKEALPLLCAEWKKIHGNL